MRLIIILFFKNYDLRLSKIPAMLPPMLLPSENEVLLDSSPSCVELENDNRLPIFSAPPKPPEFAESLLPKIPPPLISCISFKFNSCIFIIFKFCFCLLCYRFSADSVSGFNRRLIYKRKCSKLGWQTIILKHLN